MFIQVIQGQCTDTARAQELMHRWEEELAQSADGWLGMTYGVTDEDVFVAVVRFDSRDAAAANSSRPEQQHWWSEMEQCFDGPVEFHDCTDVTLMLSGGSDDAGFVQVLEGRLSDPDRFKALIGEDMEEIRHRRPEIIGGTIAIEPDGTFIQTVAFTDEATAREGEKQEMPEQARAHWDELVHDVRFLDLHRPEFASRR